MKIILITTITPDSENIRGTSALPYHLMVERRRNIDVEVYSYNLNQLTRFGELVMRSLRNRLKG